MTLPLRLGDDGPEVADLRRRLARWQAMQDPPLPGLPPGQMFDEATADAVRMFQRHRVLPADAVVGHETWTSLDEARWAPGERLLWHSTTVMRGDDVEDVQERLNQLGFNAGPEDGLFGPLTRDAVMDFQANVGLEVDGVVGEATIARLQAMYRGHHAAGVSSRVREQDDLRRLARGGLTGLQVMLDPTSPEDPEDPALARAHADLTWALATRLAGVLAGHGARPVLSRGPLGRPTPSDRAQLANRLGVDLVLVLSLNRSPGPVARGAAAYHYGSLRFVSSAGEALATSLLDATLGVGLGPDCRVHPMTWTILRETRMPVAVLEPGFVTNAGDMAALQDPDLQHRLVRRITTALQDLLRERAAG